ncbi:Small G protein signaling modulator 1 [Manis javanica]|nr:Small G protein signaling modulator 1 [Manis javanica]
MDDQLSLSARDYVESLHRNSRATLLYGKNNLLVLPRDDMEAVPGYLSLHQTADVMTLKWTPNQLMNGSVGHLDYEKSLELFAKLPLSIKGSLNPERSLSWVRLLRRNFITYIRESEPPPGLQAAWPLRGSCSEQPSFTDLPKFSPQRRASPPLLASATEVYGQPHLP